MRTLELDTRMEQCWGFSGIPGPPGTAARTSQTPSVGRAVSTGPAAPRSGSGEGARAGEGGAGLQECETR